MAARKTVNCDNSTQGMKDDSDVGCFSQTSGILLSRLRGVHVNFGIFSLIIFSLACSLHLLFSFLGVAQEGAQH